GFLHYILATTFIHVAEQAAYVGQQRSFKPLGRRDHPIVVKPHAGSFGSLPGKRARWGFLKDCAEIIGGHVNSHLSALSVPRRSTARSAADWSGRGEAAP